MISIAGTASKGWLAKTLGVGFDYDYYFDAEKRYQIDCLCQDQVAKTLPDLNIFYSESNLGRRKYFSEKQVLVGGIQPNMLLGMLVGAEFVANDSFDADISPYCLVGRDPADLPDPQSLLEHEIVKLFDRQIISLKQQTSVPLRPIPPFFWDTSGRAAIHGPVTTAQKFFGEDFFVDMLTDPEKCHDTLNWIIDSFMVLVRHFSEIGELPITGVHIGECSACMINSEMFEQFVVPAVSRIGRDVAALRFHSCGASTHLVEQTKALPSLITLDVGGETSIAKVRECFGKDFPVSIAPMATSFSAKTSEPMLAWAERVITENDGGDLLIVFHLEPNYKLDIVMDLNDYIQVNCT